MMSLSLRGDASAGCRHGVPIQGAPQCPRRCPRCPCAAAVRSRQRAARKGITRHLCLPHQADNVRAALPMNYAQTDFESGDTECAGAAALSPARPPARPRRQPAVATSGPPSARQPLASTSHGARAGPRARLSTSGGARAVDGGRLTVALWISMACFGVLLIGLFMGITMFKVHNSHAHAHATPRRRATLPHGAPALITFPRGKHAHARVWRCGVQPPATTSTL